jgi:hypothetical protein
MDAVHISPAPSDEETAAIVAAVDAMWPRAVVMAEAPPPRSAAWRFSGRWWAKPLPQRRDRPFR